jgi:hypothetical protein
VCARPAILYPTFLSFFLHFPPLPLYVDTHRNAGMVGTHHRPSDDISVFAFLTPANAMLSVELAHLKDILTTSGQTKSSKSVFRSSLPIRGCSGIRG